MAAWKKHYIDLCGVKEATQLSKGRNYLCIGKISIISLATIKNAASVIIYAHPTIRDIHIITFTNGVRGNNMKLWRGIRVISIKKKIPQNFIQLHHSFHNIRNQDVHYAGEQNNGIPNGINCNYPPKFTDHFSYQYCVSSLECNCSEDSCNEFSNQSSKKLLENHYINLMQREKQDLENEKRQLMKEIANYEYMVKYQND